MRKNSYRLTLFFLSIFTSQSLALESKFQKGAKIDYKILDQDPEKKQNYLVDKIEFQGLKNVDEGLLRSFLTIKENKPVAIPSTTIKDNINKLLESDFIEYAACYVSFVDDIHIKLIFEVIEFPIIGGYEFVGIKQRDQDKLTSKVKFLVDTPGSNKYLARLRRNIRTFYVEEKGCREAKVDFEFVDNGEKSTLKIILPEIKKTYVNKISFFGNEHVDAYFIKPELTLREKPRFTLIKDVLYKIITLQPLRSGGYLRTGYKLEDCIRYFKNHVIFIPSTTFKADALEEDKKKILNVFSKHGYNDASILKTNIKQHDDGGVDLEFFVDEGEQFWVKSLRWVGNTKYETRLLNGLLGVKNGDLLCLETINEKIGGLDGIHALYQNEGYLTSSIEPVIVGIDGNTVDLEMRVFEGDIFMVNEILITGNTHTFDEIIRRKISIWPGEIYRQYNILRSLQNLAMTDLFDMKNIHPAPTNVNIKNKTTDIVFNITENPKFKLQAKLSSGVSRKETLCVSFGFDCNNISIKDLLTFNGFLGGGQYLSVYLGFYSLKSHGLDISFKDPLLTNDRYPWGYDFGFNYSFDRKTDKKKKLDDWTIGFGLTKQLPWEDGAYSIYFKPSYKNYNFKNYRVVPMSDDQITGISHDISLRTCFARDTRDDIFFSKNGNRLALDLTTSLPYGLFSKNKNETLAEILKWRDYGLFTIEDQQFIHIWKELVLMLRARAGVNFSYSGDVTTNKFVMGGGVSSTIIPSGVLATQTVPLRGYEDDKFQCGKDKFGIPGGRFFGTGTVELRCLAVDLSAMFKMYLLGFVDVGLVGNDIRKDVNWENLKKSVGFGVRFMVPMLGILGFDWGYGFDSNKTDKWEFHFQFG